MVLRRLAIDTPVKLIDDFAYAEVCFDGYRAPSILEVPGGRDVAIEFVSLSKSHSMAGWRVAFMLGNREVIEIPVTVPVHLEPGPLRVVAASAVSDCGGRGKCNASHLSCDAPRQWQADHEEPTTSCQSIGLFRPVHCPTAPRDRLDLRGRSFMRVVGLCHLLTYICGSERAWQPAWRHRGARGLKGPPGRP